jgi:hypothetical protein
MVGEIHITNTQTDGRYLWSMPFRCHDIHTNYHKDWFRNSEGDRGDSQTYRQHGDLINPHKWEMLNLHCKWLKHPSVHRIQHENQMDFWVPWQQGIFFNWYSGGVEGVESNWVHLALQPLIDLLCQPWVIMIMEKLVEWLAGETEVSRENLRQCRFVHHKPHMLPGHKPGPPRWEASD